MTKIVLQVLLKNLTDSICRTNGPILFNSQIFSELVDSMEFFGFVPLVLI